jgi:SAM-dependent methyltransferase
MESSPTESGASIEEVDAVRWHDIECDTYNEDFGLWELLAAEADGPILEVGAGTGRVALHLATQGYELTALDIESDLLQALTYRAVQSGVKVTTIAADARSFLIENGSFNLICVPMSSIQLFGATEGRLAFFKRAQRHLAPGATLGVAITELIETFDTSAPLLPLPDAREYGGRRYLSQPTAVRAIDDSQFTIERIRRIIGTDGSLESEEPNILTLSRVTSQELRNEGTSIGLHHERTVVIPPSKEHIGASVVIFRG